MCYNCRFYIVFSVGSVSNADGGHCFAVNCFSAAVLLGVRGHGLHIPTDVAKHLDPRAQHQALRRLLLAWAVQLEKRIEDEDDGEALAAMKQSLQDRQHVLDEVAMLVVEMFDDQVTVNIIMGVTTMEALTVTSFAGEQQH